VFRRLLSIQPGLEGRCPQADAVWLVDPGDPESLQAALSWGRSRRARQEPSRFVVLGDTWRERLQMFALPFATTHAVEFTAEIHQKLTGSAVSGSEPAMSGHNCGWKASRQAGGGPREVTQPVKSSSVGAAGCSVVRGG